MLKNKNLIKIFTLITFLIMITVNALANIFPDQVWTIIILFVGAIIAALTTIREKNLSYGLVPVWAYFGIYLKHGSPDFLMECILM